MSKELKAFVLSVVATCATIVVVSVGTNRCAPYQRGSDTTIVKVVDTVTIVKRDTIPQLVSEVVTKYVKVPVPGPTDTCYIRDSLELPVVQRVYTDDSSYTAYVSGVRVIPYPRLDSISVKERVIRETITQTITKQPRRWQLGITGGYGYGLNSRRFEPFVGVGISLKLF